MTFVQEIAIARTGERVRAARLKAELSQQSLAERAGLGLRTVIRIESGEGSQFSSLVAIAAVLGVPLGQLVDDGDGEPIAAEA